MNFKLEFKHDLESRICKGETPIVNSEMIKSKLTFSMDDSNVKPVATTTNKSFKLIFAKSAYFMVSLMMGIFVGGGIVYGLTVNKQAQDITKEYTYVGLDGKKNIIFDIKTNVIPVCSFFLSETAIPNLEKANIINENNLQTLESVEFVEHMQVVYTPVTNFDESFASVILYEKDEKEYLYLLTKNDDFCRYRLESNLPYTSQELITSFEEKIGSTLATEFLNGKDTGIFSQLKFDTYSHEYYLEHELRFEELTYIAKYDFNQNKIIVKTLI